MSAHKGHSWNLILVAPDLRALKPHCVKTRHYSVLKITAWAQEPFQKSLSENTVHRVIHKMQVKALSCKEEAIYEHNPEIQLSSVGQSSFRMDRGKVEKNVLWLDELKCKIFWGNHGHRVLQTEDKRDHPAGYQCSIQEPASLMRCISARTADLHISAKQC